jgi:hypothetical protein
MLRHAAVRRDAEAAYELSSYFSTCELDQPLLNETLGWAVRAASAPVLEEIPRDAARGSEMVCLSALRVCEMCVIVAQILLHLRDAEPPARCIPPRVAATRGDSEQYLLDRRHGLALLALEWIDRAISLSLAHGCDAACTNIGRIQDSARAVLPTELRASIPSPSAAEEREDLLFVANHETLVRCEIVERIRRSWASRPPGKCRPGRQSSSKTASYSEGSVSSSGEEEEEEEEECDTEEEKGVDDDDETVAESEIDGGASAGTRTEIHC